MAANRGNEDPKRHREVDLYFQAVNALGDAGQRSLDSSLEEIRRKTDDRARLLAGNQDFDGSEREVIVPSCNSTDGIPVSIYTPNGLPETPSILVFFHGGGFIIGSRQNAEVPCKAIARIANCIVLNVEYRLAPEHKMPAAIDDAAEVMTWVLTNKQKVGGSGNSTVGVCGLSAGGTISADICYEVAGINYQILVNPKVDMRSDRPSYYEIKDDTVNPASSGAWINERAFGDNYRSVRGRPMDRETCDHHLPPALFIVSECDTMRDDSYDYEKKLREAGVKTEFLLIKGVMHNFLSYPRIYKETTKLAFDKIAEFIQQCG